MPWFLCYRHYGESLGKVIPISKVMVNMFGRGKICLCLYCQNNLRWYTHSLIWYILHMWIAIFISYHAKFMKAEMHQNSIMHGRNILHAQIHLLRNSLTILYRQRSCPCSLNLKKFPFLQITLVHHHDSFLSTDAF